MRTDGGNALLSKVMQAHMRVVFLQEVFLKMVTLEVGIFAVGDVL